MFQLKAYYCSRSCSTQIPSETPWHSVCFYKGIFLAGPLGPGAGRTVAALGPAGSRAGPRRALQPLGCPFPPPDLKKKVSTATGGKISPIPGYLLWRPSSALAAPVQRAVSHLQKLPARPTEESHPDRSMRGFTCPRHRRTESADSCGLNPNPRTVGGRLRRSASLASFALLMQIGQTRILPGPAEQAAY